MDENIRINKYLSSCGYCSRRKADYYLENGRVTVDGIKAELGTRVNSQSVVCVDGKIIEKTQEKVVIAFNKPIGIVCTSSKVEKNNIIDYIGYPERIYPVGRLDKDSTGLILLTNDGELTDRILRGKNMHEKEYIVRVNKPMKKEIIQAMSQGVPILDTMTRPCRVKKIDDFTLNITLTQGLNRQIRRMCEYFGYRVVTLKRVRVMNIELDKLAEGKWRRLSEDEINYMEQSMKGQKFYNE